MKTAVASLAGLWLIVAVLAAQSPAGARLDPSRDTGPTGRQSYLGRVSPADARGPAAQAAPAATAAAAAPGAVLKQYCMTCHSARLKSGGLVLEGLDPAQVSGHLDEWEKVVRKVKTGMMPPGRQR